MKGLGSTLVLVAVLAGLAGYIYYDRDRDPAASETKEKVFGTIETDDVEEVQITSVDGETTRVRKADGKWRLAEPVDAAADEGELSSIASSLSTIDIQRVVEENAPDLTQYGLDPARLDVSFRTKGQAEPRRILFGEKTPTGGDMYARLPDQKRVFLVSSFLESTFNKNTFALRDKTILQFESDKVDGLEVSSGGTTIRLSKAGSDWKLVSPVAARADYATAEGAVERLRSVQMQGIAADDAGGELAKYGLDRPSATMTVSTGSSRATLLLGNTDNALVYAKDASRPMVFTVAPTLKDDVLKAVGDFRRKDLFDSRSFTVTRAELRRGGETIVLEKAKDGETDVWKNASGAAVDTAKAEDVLTKLSALRAESFAAAAHPSLKAAALTAVVRFDGDKTETVTFGRAGTDVYAARADEPGSATVDATAFDDAMKALDAVK